MIAPAPKVPTHNLGDASLQTIHNLVTSINSKVLKDSSSDPDKITHNNELNARGFQIQQDELDYEADPSGGSSGTAGKKLLSDWNDYKSAANKYSHNAGDVENLLNEFANISGIMSNGNLAEPGDPNSASGKGWKTNFEKNAKDAPKFGLSPPAGDGEASIGHSKQKSESDCFLLAAIGAINATPGGAAQLNSLIHTNSDGSYDVTFPGDPHGKKYTVTAAELKSDDVASGDTTTKILTIAADKWDIDNGGDGIAKKGTAAGALTLLTGKMNDHLHGGDIKSTIIKNAKDGKPTELGALVGYDSSDPPNPIYHAIFVNSYDPKTGIVTWTNPYDSSKQYKQNIDDFLSHPAGGIMGIVEIDSTTDTAGTVNGQWHTTATGSSGFGGLGTSSS
jgi:hypothetical protein